MKLGKLFMVLLSVGACFIMPERAMATLELDLWMTGDYDSATGIITAEVHFTNVDFGLGGLAYDLQFSESFELSREYSDYGWTANDGIFDISNPVDVGGTGSIPGIFIGLRFDTVVDPAGSEFPPGSSGIVEVLTGKLVGPAPHWIYFDLIEPSASDGFGQDLETALGGSIDVINDPQSDHTLALYIPEPCTLILIGLGGLALLRGRKT